VKPDVSGVWKVVFTRSGSIRQARVDCISGVSELALYVPCATQREAENLLAVLQSKLYQFLIFCCRFSASIPNDVSRNLPLVDLSRSWTDNDLYIKFGLSGSEIQLINDTIK